MMKAMMHGGRIAPIVAAMAPGMPAILMPTNVAAFMATGPGVSSSIVTISENSL